MKTFEHYIVVGKPVYVNKEGSIKHAVEGLINGTSIWLAPVDDLQPVTKELTAEELNKIALNFGVLGWDLLLTEISNGGFSKEDVINILKQFAAQHKEQKQQSGKERQVYHLNCDKCGKTFWSQEAFPEPQLCFDCGKQKEPLPRQMIRDIAVIYENFLKDNDISKGTESILCLHALYAKIYDYIDQKQLAQQITNEEIEIEMDNRSWVTSWDRKIGRTMARWARDKSQNQKQK
jgi:hypothetical protein